MGSFEQGDEEQSFTFPSAPVPKGWHVRGSYALTVEFIDDAGTDTQGHFEVRVTIGFRLQGVLFCGLPDFPCLRPTTRSLEAVGFSLGYSF